MAIYEPSGKAREYSPLALNIYLTCAHGCRYCYAPSATHCAAEKYFASLPTPRPMICDTVLREISEDKPDRQVLLSFVGDPYGPSSDSNAATSAIVRMFSDYEVPYAVLTKGGPRCLGDLEIFRRSVCQIGATLTFLDPDKSIAWEPGAALPQSRLDTLDILHRSGVRTFASFEPVIEPAESLALIRRTLDLGCIDTYKIGKLNNYRGLDKKIDWQAFAAEALDMIREAGREVYVKNDLAAQCPGLSFRAGERDADRHAVGRRVG